MPPNNCKRVLIARAIAAYAEDDAYWLKWYHLIGAFGDERLNELYNEARQRSREIFGDEDE